MAEQRQREKILMRNRINAGINKVQLKLKDYLGPDRDLQVKNFIKCADLMRDSSRILKYETLRKMTYYMELMFRKFKIEH